MFMTDESITERQRGRVRRGKERKLNGQINKLNFKKITERLLTERSVCIVDPAIILCIPFVYVHRNVALSSVCVYQNAVFVASGLVFIELQFTSTCKTHNAHAANCTSAVTVSLVTCVFVWQSSNLAAWQNKPSISLLCGDSAVMLSPILYRWDNYSWAYGCGWPGPHGAPYVE